jgi:uncharacterized damage-inducible protein DinB
MSATPATFIAAPDLLQHWQGLRRLTRRVILAFPDDKLFTHAVGGMRPFGELARELLGIATPVARGMVTGEWSAYSDAEAGTRAELLRQWDASTEEINTLFAQIPAERFAEVSTAFGQFTGPGWSHIAYAIDNENHHRGQGYVYLRSLGIEPPPFWERD